MKWNPFIKYTQESGSSQISPYPGLIKYGERMGIDPRFLGGGLIEWGFRGKTHRPESLWHEIGHWKSGHNVEVNRKKSVLEREVEAWEYAKARQPNIDPSIWEGTLDTHVSAYPEQLTPDLRRRIAALKRNPILKFGPPKGVWSTGSYHSPGESSVFTKPRYGKYKGEPTQVVTQDEINIDPSQVIGGIRGDPADLLSHEIAHWKLKHSPWSPKKLEQEVEAWELAVGSHPGIDKKLVHAALNSYVKNRPDEMTPELNSRIRRLVYNPMRRKLSCRDKVYLHVRHISDRNRQMWSEEYGIPKRNIKTVDEVCPQWEKSGQSIINRLAKEAGVTAPRLHVRD
ncbi:MAG: hypothetical protein Q8O55_01205, partial [Dehalococcoidales bacterium]|nr:hypothetical protein [Dehalococcoidales bacterium]